MNVRGIASRLLLALALALAGAIAWALMHGDQVNPADLQQQIQHLGPWAPLAFNGLFALATVLYLPAAIFGLIGGALFGPASLNIPLSDLAARLGELASSKHRQVAIVWRTDKRSAKAAELLIEASFADVAIVRGGTEQWQREGFVLADATTG